MTLSLLACSSPPLAPCPVAVPVPAGLERTVTQRTGVGGIQLSVQRWRDPAHPPRATLVLVHGLKDHGDHYAEFSARLAQQGVQVVAADLRGHGRSGGERVWIEQFGEYLDDTAALIGEVVAEAPQRPVFLFGHSMGGAIATLTLLDKKPAIAGLILSAPALVPGADVSGFLIGVTKAIASIAPHSAVLDLPDDKFSRDPKVVAGMACDPLIDHEKGPARTAAELLRAMARIESRMAEVSVPVLALHGTADVVTNPEGSKQLIAKAKSTDKTLKEFPGLYHDLWHEPEHAQVEDAALTWLAAHIGAELPAASTPAGK
ncbi:MAG: lysophospholipase [Deltaproteobacteria bacterium]|nr:lysophospholipase [Deltaproteobacteria bacterium]